METSETRRNRWHTRGNGFSIVFFFLAISAHRRHSESEDFGEVRLFCFFFLQFFFRFAAAGNVAWRNGAVVFALGFLFRSVSGSVSLLLSLFIALSLSLSLSFSFFFNY